MLTNEAEIISILKVLNDKIDTLSTSLNQKIESQSISLNDKVESLSTSLNHKIDSQTTSLNHKIESLNEKIDLNAVRMMEFFTEMYDKLKIEISEVRHELKKEINDTRKEINDLRLETKEDHKVLYYEVFKSKNTVDDHELRITDLEDKNKSN